MSRQKTKLSKAAVEALRYAQAGYGDDVAAAMLEFTRNESRLEWLDKNAPIGIRPSMSDEEILSAIDADENADERRALVKRNRQLFDRIPPSVMLAYRFPGVPMLVIR